MTIYDDSIAILFSFAAFITTSRSRDAAIPLINTSLQQGVAIT
jgi:hypothetical protein